LEAETSPEYLSRNAFLWAEHVKARLLMGIVNLGRLDIHTWPSLRKYAAEFTEPIWVMMPNVPEVPGCGVVE
jgi:hypothetical protein